MRALQRVARAPATRRPGVRLAPVAPSLLEAVALLGEPVVGSATSFSTVHVSGTEPIGVSTRFMLDAVPVGSVNDQSHVWSAGDVGKTRQLRVTLTGPGGTLTTDFTDGVIAAASGGAGVTSRTLSWLAPEFDGANQPITDLADFVVYTDTVFEGRATSAVVANTPEADGYIRYTTPLLPVGRHYFMVVARDSAGNESNVMASREGYYTDIV